MVRSDGVTTAVVSVVPQGGPIMPEEGDASKEAAHLSLPNHFDVFLIQSFKNFFPAFDCFFYREGFSFHLLFTDETCSL